MADAANEVTMKSLGTVSKTEVHTVRKKKKRVKGKPVTILFWSSVYKVRR